MRRKVAGVTLGIRRLRAKGWGTKKPPIIETRGALRTMITSFRNPRSGLRFDSHQAACQYRSVEAQPRDLHSA